MNIELEKALRLADFIEMGYLMTYEALNPMTYEALNRNESCGGHFREEYQTEDGEAKRDEALVRGMLELQGRRRGSLNCGKKT